MTDPVDDFDAAEELMTTQLWTVEWSGSQRCFHVDTMGTTIRRNLETYATGRSNDYQILAIAASYEDAHRIAREIENETAARAA